MDIDLTGIVDLHLHSGPDIRPRRYDDIELAQVCREAGLRAILIKSHMTLTADRAVIAERVVPGIRIFGSLVLNQPVGGLNPAAVETAVRMGVKEIWMPTSSAAWHLAFYRRFQPDYQAGVRGISILDQDGKLLPVVHEILGLVAKSDVILGTGHLSPQEVAILVPTARQAGVKNIIVTHPGLAISAIPLDLQRAIAGAGVWFEHCFIATLFRVPTPWEEIAESIRILGPECTILSSDLGQQGMPELADGWRAYLLGLLNLGISWSDLERMAKANPAELMGL